LFLLGSVSEKHSVHREILMSLVKLLRTAIYGMPLRHVNYSVLGRDALRRTKLVVLTALMFLYH